MRSQPAKQSARRQRPLLEMLEARQLLSSTVFQYSAATHQLTVNGTPANDQITVSLKGKKLVAKMDGKSRKISAATVQSLVVNAGAGDDTVTVASTVTATSTLNGGTGDDTITGGGGTAVLDGGTGNNVLQGGSSTNNFVPGGGTDAVFNFHDGDAGEDGSNGQPGAPGQDGKFFGSVASVGATANTITINTLAQGAAVAQKTFNVPSGTTITVDGQPSTLAALGTLTAGAHVVIAVSTTDATTATSIEAVGPHVQGAVSAVDSTANTITLAGQNGAAATTYTVSSTAAITVSGAASTLSAITAGTKVQLWLSATDGTTTVAIDAGDAGAHQGGGQGGEGHGGAAIGSIVSVDSTAGTITLSVLAPSGTSQQTFTVTTSTAIKVDGVTATLSDLASLSSTARVIVQVASGSTTTASAISAVGPHVNGDVTAVNSATGAITVQGPHGAAAQTFTVGSSAVITVDGAASSLSAISTGGHADIRLSATDGTTVIAINAGTEGSGPGTGGATTGGGTGEGRGGGGTGGGSTGGGTGGPGTGGTGGQTHAGAAIGVVSSVDTTAGTLTLSILSPAGTTQQQTFTVTSSTTITVDGKPAALAALSSLNSKAHIIVKTDATSATTAVSIDAVGPLAQGRVASVDLTAGTITLVPPPGGTTGPTFTIGSAPVAIDGSTGAFSDITAGMGVHIKLSAVDGTTVVSVDANGKGGGSGPVGGTGPTGGGTGTTGGGTGPTGSGTGPTGGSTGPTGGGTGTPGGGPPSGGPPTNPPHPKQ